MLHLPRARRRHPCPWPSEPGQAYRVHRPEREGTMCQSVSTHRKRAENRSPPKATDDRRIIDPLPSCVAHNSRAKTILIITRLQSLKDMHTARLEMHEACTRTNTRMHARQLMTNLQKICLRAANSARNVNARLQSVLCLAQVAQALHSRNIKKVGFAS